MRKKNKTKIWEWVLLVSVVSWILFREKITAVLAEIKLNNPQQAGKSGEKKGWFRRLAQGIIGTLPFGNVVNTVWNLIWP